MSTTVFIGNLPLDVREREVEDLFYKYGRIVEIDLKLPSRPPGFAFVEFSDTRDASDACRGRDGYEFGGQRLRVELARGSGRRGGGMPPRGYGGPPPRGYGGGGGGRYDDRPPPRALAAPPKSGFRVVVSGLPKSASWQDLKDHFRKAGDVTFTQVFRDRDGTVGIVDFSTKDDMKYAIRKLDDTEFRNPFEKSYIRIKEDAPARSRSRSYDSRSRSRSRSYSRSPLSRSRSRSRSKSPAGSKSRSRSRSRSVSKSKSPARSASPVKEAGAGEALNGKGRSPSRSPSPMRSD